MNEIIVQADVEAIVIGHLADVLSVPVSQKIPPTRPVSFVTVMRTGGLRQTLVSTIAQVTVDSWAASAPAASALARSALAEVHAMVGEMFDGHPVYRVGEVAGVAYTPDPESQTDRYRFTVALHIRDGGDAQS